MNGVPDLPPRSDVTASHGALPGIGDVPEADDAEPSAKLVGSNSKDPNSRSFNLLRAQLIKKLSRNGSHLVGITSPAPNAGKSFIASNLAASLGQLPNKRTFLVDLDLRRATIADIFGLSVTEGMTEFLIDETVELRRIGRHFRDSNLVVYPTLAGPINSAELMVSERLGNFFAMARELGDDAIVIVDLPPTFANDDAILAAEKLDGVLLVVEQGVTTKKQLQGTLQLISPTPILGTVFNRFTGGTGDPYGYGGKYSGYYSAE